MKLDVISVVVIVFCLGVCISLFTEVKNMFGTPHMETVIAESK